MTTSTRLRHVVLFGFKAGTSAEELRRIEAEFTALPARIPQIREFEWGTDESPEGLAEGHTHCFLVTFASASDRDAYLVHPDHLRFVELLERHLEKATVVDYWARSDGAPEALLRKLDCHSLPVEDLDAALAFYGCLGHRILWRDGAHAAGLHLPDSDAEIVLHTDARPAETYFLVESVPAAIERIRTAGGKLVRGPFEIQVGSCAMLLDPWNNPLLILDFSKGLLETDAAGNVIGNRPPG